MEVKLIHSEKNPRHLELWREEVHVTTIDKILFKKQLSKISKMVNIQEEFEILEKKVAFSYFLWLLGRRAYSLFEIKKKLLDLLISPGSSDYIVEKLSPYLSDETLIESILRAEIGKKKGERAIMQKLIKRLGLSYNEAKEILRQAYPASDQKAAARKIAAQKKPKDQKEKQKAMRRLLSKGFSYEIALEAVREAWTENYEGK